MPPLSCWDFKLNKSGDGKEGTLYAPYSCLQYAIIGFFIREHWPSLFLEEMIVVNKNHRVFLFQIQYEGDGILKMETIQVHSAHCSVEGANLTARLCLVAGN